GGYSYKAVYGGNGNYSGSNSGCEPFTGNAAGSTTSTLVKDVTTTVDNTTHAALGDQTHDTSSVSGQVGTFSLAGTVTYSLYPTTDCSGTASPTYAEAFTSPGAVPSFPPRRSSDLGGYSYKAVYGGNGNYSGSNSGCEP